MGVVYDRTAELVRRVFDIRVVGQPTLNLVDHFPDGYRLQAAWRDIRDEAAAIARRLDRVPRFHDIMPEQAPVSANDDRDWRLFILKAYGTPIPRNMAQCPRLAALVTRMPDVLSTSLSFLAPGKHIPEHRGPFRGVLRFYMPLAMPRDERGRPAAVLRINGRDHAIDEGDCLLWDDTYPHEVWNKSEDVRCALLLDVRRHGMPLDMKILSNALILMAGLGVRIRGVDGKPVAVPRRENHGAEATGGSGSRF
ncbi:MAG TPA: aspartyl/asparaginyl beta-hydroxylase domain-containing protein [Alphaproteobacteria bacterium]|nr:aspartyl/asparaginyl beta-hydroxylase domain-containing protein [Alphaproteobacteria bacterium]